MGVFDEDDEAHELTSLPEEVELFRFGQWIKGWLGEHGDVYISERYTLKTVTAFAMSSRCRMHTNNGFPSYPTTRFSILFI